MGRTLRAFVTAAGIRKHALPLIVAAMFVTASSSAWGLAYTVAASYAISSPGMSGSVDPVTDLSGTTTCLSGICSGASSQDWLLFSVTLNSSSYPASQIEIYVPAVYTVMGAGHFNDPGKTPTSAGILTFAAGTLGQINYDYPSSSQRNLAPGETTDRLFLAFSTGDSLPGPGYPGLYDPGSVRFQLWFPALVVPAYTGGLMVLVPEPGALVLMGTGLFGLGLARHFAAKRANTF